MSNKAIVIPSLAARRLQKFFPILFLTALALLLCANGALAHSKLKESKPASHEELNKAPSNVVLIFSKAIETAFSKVRVFDGDGKQVDNGKITVSGEKNHILQVGLSPVGVGDYTVKYSAVAKDGHKVKGEYTFHVVE